VSNEVKAARQPLLPILAFRELSSLAMLAVVVVVFYIINADFLSRENITVVLETSPELGIVAAGVTVLMICGEFDLSVGSVFALAPIFTASVMNWGVPAGIAFIGVLIFCGLIGALNGFVTLRFGIPSFITTLGAMMIWRGIVLLITGGWPPEYPPAADALKSVLVGNMGMLYASLFWYAGITLLLWIALERTKFGNWTFATGGNLNAARVMGISTGRVKMTAFIVTSVLAGFAGVVQGFRLGALVPSAGTGMELDTIAAAVIGGTVLSGGIGTVFGTVIGTFLIRVIDNGLIMARAPGYWFRVFIGMLTIVAVIINISIAKRMRRLR
jgi:simple sugar transport system permease protein